MVLVTLSEENYLKSIYHLSKHGTISVSTNALSEKMETKASSVTDMLKKLADKDYVNYKRYQGVDLTEKRKYKAHVQAVQPSWRSHSKCHRRNRPPLRVIAQPLEKIEDAGLLVDTPKRKPKQKWKLNQRSRQRLTV